MVQEARVDPHKGAGAVAAARVVVGVLKVILSSSIIISRASGDMVPDGCKICTRIHNMRNGLV